MSDDVGEQLRRFRSFMNRSEEKPGLTPPPAEGSYPVLGGNSEPPTKTDVACAFLWGLLDLLMIG